jgi:hypothetical protein
MSTLFRAIESGVINFKLPSPFRALRHVGEIRQSWNTHINNVKATAKRKMQAII